MAKKEEPKAKSKPLTIQEFASLGGNARARKLTKKERKAIASTAAKKRWAKADEAAGS